MFWICASGVAFLIWIISLALRVQRSRILVPRCFAHSALQKPINPTPSPEASHSHSHLNTSLLRVNSSQLRQRTRPTRCIRDKTTLQFLPLAQHRLPALDERTRSFAIHNEPVSVLFSQ